MDSNRLSPKDPKFIETILHEVKSKGHFDSFRKQCLEHIDTRPAFLNLRQRVETSVTNFLGQQRWTPDLNRNQLRERLRRHIVDSGFLESGVERIVDQVVNPKISTDFQPKVEEIVYTYLGIEKPRQEISIDTGNDDFLPGDLEAVSPDSDKKSPDVPVEEPTENLEEENEFESPPFEPLEIKRPSVPQPIVAVPPPPPPPPPPPEEEEYSSSDDKSNDSKISGLTSSESIDSVKEVVEEVVIEQEIVGEIIGAGGGEEEEEGEVKDSPIPPEVLEISQNESQLSQVSSNSRLSIITNNNSEDIRNTPRLDITEEAQMPKFNENSNSVECSTAKNEEEPQKSNFDLQKEEYEFKCTERKMPAMTADEMEIDTSKDESEATSIVNTKQPNVAEEVKVPEEVEKEKLVIDLQVVNDPVESSSHSEHSLRIYEESLTESKGLEPSITSTTEITKVDENSSNSKSKDEKDKDRQKKSEHRRDKDDHKDKERKKSSSSRHHHHSSSSKERSSLTKDDHSKTSGSGHHRDRDRDRSHHKSSDRRSHSHSSGQHHHHHHSDHRRSSKSKKDDKDKDDKKKEDKDDKKKTDDHYSSHEKSSRKRRSTDHDSNDGANGGAPGTEKSDDKKANKEPVATSTESVQSPEERKPDDKQGGGNADTSVDMNDTAEPLFEGFEESPIKKEALELAKKPKGPTLSSYMSKNRAFTPHQKKKSLKNGQKTALSPPEKPEDPPSLDVFSFSFEKPLKLGKNGEILPEPEPEPELLTTKDPEAAESDIISETTVEETVEISDEIESFEDTGIIDSIENGPISVEQMLTNGDNFDLEQLIGHHQIEDTETRQKIQETIQAVNKIKKPKIASNFQEARRLMKVRKQMVKEEQKLKEKAMVLAKKYITEHKPETDNQGVELEFACENKTAKPIISSPLRKKPKMTDDETEDLLYLPENDETFKQDEHILEYLRKQIENYKDESEVIQLDVKLFTIESFINVKRKLAMEEEDKMKTMDELFRENNKLNFVDSSKTGKRVRKPNNRYSSIDYDFHGDKAGVEVPEKKTKMTNDGDEEDKKDDKDLNVILETETTIQESKSSVVSTNSPNIKKKAVTAKTKSKSQNIATPNKEKPGIDARTKKMATNNNNNSISKQKYTSADLYKPRSKNRAKV